MVLCMGKGFLFCRFGDWKFVNEGGYAHLIPNQLRDTKTGYVLRELMSSDLFADEPMLACKGPRLNLKRLCPNHPRLELTLSMMELCCLFRVLDPWIGNYLPLAWGHARKKHPVGKPSTWNMAFALPSFNDRTWQFHGSLSLFPSLLSPMLQCLQHG